MKIVNYKLVVIIFIALLGFSTYIVSADYWGNPIETIDEVGNRGIGGQGCNKMIFYDNITYMTYSTESGIYVTSFNHSSETQGSEYYVASAPNDHYESCLLMDDNGYFYLGFGARPDPFYIVKSKTAYDISSFDFDRRDPFTLYVYPSLTYPKMWFMNGKIYLFARQGNSATAGKLMLFEITTSLVKTDQIDMTYLTSKYIPYPLDVEKDDDRFCMMWNLKDSTLDFMTVFPLIREGMSITCYDGDTWTDLVGNNITSELPYYPSYNLYNLPYVLDEDIVYSNNEIMTSYSQDYNNFYSTNDGSFIDINITLENYNGFLLMIKDNITYNNPLINYLIFSSDGYIYVTNDSTQMQIAEYTANETYRIRMKYYFSLQKYKLWVNGTSISAYDFTYHSDINKTSIQRAEMYVNSPTDYEMYVGKNFKESVGSLHKDSSGQFHIFFTNRIDNFDSINFDVGHWIDGEYLGLINNQDYDAYGTSVSEDETNIYVAVEYFIKDEETSYSSYYGMFNETGEIYLLNSTDGDNWDEQYITFNTTDGNTNPIFMESFASTSPYHELLWIAKASGDVVSSTLKYTFFPVLYDSPIPIKYSKNFIRPEKI